MNTTTRLNPGARKQPGPGVGSNTNFCVREATISQEALPIINLMQTNCHKTTRDILGVARAIALQVYASSLWLENAEPHSALLELKNA